MQNCADNTALKVDILEPDTKQGKIPLQSNSGSDMPFQRTLCPSTELINSLPLAPLQHGCNGCAIPLNLTQRQPPPILFTNSHLGQSWAVYNHILRQTVTERQFMCVTLSPSLTQGVSNGQKREVIRCSEVMTGQLTQERKRQIEGEIKRGRDVGHFPIVSESLLWNTHSDTTRTRAHTPPHMSLDLQAACV